MFYLSSFISFQCAIVSNQLWASFFTLCIDSRDEWLSSWLHLAKLAESYAGLDQRLENSRPDFPTSAGDLTGILPFLLYRIRSTGIASWLGNHRKDVDRERWCHLPLPFEMMKSIFCSNRSNYDIFMSVEELTGPSSLLVCICQWRLWSETNRARWKHWRHKNVYWMHRRNYLFTKCTTSVVCNCYCINTVIRC